MDFLEYLNQKYEKTPEVGDTGGISWNSTKSIGTKITSGLKNFGTGVVDYFKSLKNVKPIDVVKEIPNQLSVQIGQPSMRAYGGFANWLLGEKGFKPSGQFQQDLYGTDKPITFTSVGEEVVGQGPIRSKYIAPALGAFFAVADITPAGKPLKEGAKEIRPLIAQLVRMADEANIQTTLRPLGFSEDLSSELSQGIKMINTETKMSTGARSREIQNLIDEAIRRSNTVPEGPAKSVVQVVKKDGKDVFYEVDPSTLKTLSEDLIDGTKRGIAGKTIDGNIYHLTAKTPTQMIENAGFKNGGKKTLDEIMQMITPKKRVPIRSEDGKFMGSFMDDTPAFKVAAKQTADEYATILERKAVKGEGEFDLTIPEAEATFRNFFTPQEVGFIIRDEIKDGKQFGNFSRQFKSVVEVVKKEGKVQSDTVYHESFHAYFNTFLRQEERQAILEKLKQSLATSFSRGYKRFEGYEGADIRAEEWLADDFARYMREISAGKKPTSVFAEIWQKVVKHIRQMIRKANHVDQLYADIVARKRNHVEKPLRKPIERFKTSGGEFSETLPKDVSVAEEAKRVGAKRIAPDRVAHQQLTPEAGMEALVKKAEKRANDNAQSWLKAADGLNDIIKKYEGKVPERGTDDFYKFSSLKKYAIGAKTPTEMRDQFLAKAERVKWDAEKEKRVRETLREDYVALVKADISKGYKYPEAVLKFDRSFEKAIDSRARYEKGLATSFGADDSRIVFHDVETIGAGMKRQDGKQITEAQIADIKDGVVDFADTLGLDMKKLAENNRWVYVHLNGKNPFLMKDTSGLYRQGKDSVSISVGGKESFERIVDGEVVKEFVHTTMAHELGHAIDFKTGNKLFDSRLVYDRSKDYNPVNYGSRGAKYWSSRNEVTARMIEQYVAVKKGHTTIYDQAGQWSKKIFDEEIAPAVEKAIDTHFKDFRKVIPEKKEVVDAVPSLKELDEAPTGPEKEYQDMLTHMIRAEKGERILNTKDGYTTGVSRKGSTFPEWLPEDLRSRELFDKYLKDRQGTLDDFKQEYKQGSRMGRIDDIVRNRLFEKTGQDFRIVPDSEGYYDQLASEYDEFYNGATVAKRREEARSIREGTASQGMPQDILDPEVALKMFSLDKSIQSSDSLVNLTKLDVSPEAKKFLEATVEDVKPYAEKKVGETLTNKEMLEYAEKNARMLERAVGREQTMAWEAAMFNARENLARLAERGIVDKEYIDALVNVKALGADLGRKLQSLSIKAQPNEAKALDAVLEEVLKVADNADEVLKAAEGVDFKNYKETAEFYRKFVKPRMSEWIDMVRYNSMLSSPLTHFVNIFSNLVNSALVGTTEKLTVGAFDMIRGTLTGTGRERFAGEAGAFLKEYMSNIGEATDRFTETLRGERAISNLDTRSIPLATSGPAKAVENVLTVPMRFLEAADQFFTALTEAGELGALKYRQSKGVKVSAPIVKAQEAAQYRLYRQELFSEGQGTVLNAIDHVTNTIYNLRNSENPIISNIFKFTVPFIRTPTNIFKQGIEYSPIGVTTLAGASDKELQLAKAAIGTTIFTGAAILLASDRLTWAEPTSEKERNMWRDAGKQPYSVKIGDTWVQYQKLPPPIAFPISMVSVINEAQKDRKISDSTIEMILGGIAKYGSFLADQSYAKSMGDLLSAVKGGESDWARVIGNVPQQLVPYRALGGWLSKLLDNVQRKPDPEGTFIDKQVQLLMMNIPGLSDNVPARTNQFGEEIKNEQNIINAFSPVRISEEKPRGIEILTKYMDNKLESAEKKDARAKFKEEVFLPMQTMDREEAQKKLDSLTEEEYEMYKSVRASWRSSNMSEVRNALEYDPREAVKIMKALPQKEAERILNLLTDEEYALYETGKTKNVK